MGRVSGVLSAAGFTVPLSLRTQIISLDDQFLEMEREITGLNAKILGLEAQVNPLQREVDRLKKQLEPRGALRLNEEETKIMKYFCHFHGAEFAGKLSDETEINSVRMKVFLKSLMDRGLIRAMPHWQGAIMYALTDDGAVYAVEQGWA